MAFVSNMNRPDPGDLASSTDYKIVLDNVLDLDERLSSAINTNGDQSSAIGTLETTVDALVNANSSVLARYYNSTTQSIQTNSWTRMVVPTTLTTTDKVTRNGANNTFTVNLTGVYTISTAARFASNAVGARHVVISDGGSESARWSGNSVPSGVGFFTPGATTSRYLTAGSTVSVWVFQDSGGALNLEPSGETNHVSIMYAGA